MIGQRLAHYEILAKLGEGGMGEVYRARDHKLERDVALKVLPQAMSGDPERIARFQREARTLAALQHPNIASVYGFEDTPEARFLVMELVEGEELTARLGQGPLPVDEAVRIARQLADGLAAAHERNIVHRDLKPANIKFAPDGTVKILDFGLARAYSGEPEGEGELEASPTITAAMTQAGTILGTAAYMSPEQAKGRTADHRADIWAWGVILWEMLSGERLFTGDSISDTLAGVLRQEVDTGALPAGTPPALRELVAKCLQRDPRERLQHIGDASIYLDRPPGGPAPDGGPGPWRWAALTLAVVSLTFATLWLVGRDAVGDRPTPRVHRWSFAPPGESTTGVHSAAIAPDGHAIAYANEEGLWIRRRDELVPLQLFGGGGATALTWSPDSRSILFTTDNRVLRIASTGGQPTPVGLIPAGMSGSSGALAWDGHNHVVLGNGATALQEIRSVGANARDIYEAGEAEIDVHTVAALPGWRGWVFVVHEKSGQYGRIDLLTAEGERRTLLNLAPTNVGAVAVDPAGYLLFRSEGSNPGIWAVALSMDSFELGGDPFLVAPEGDHPTVSADGTLAYTLGAFNMEGELAWLDREGHELDVLAKVGTSRPFPYLLPGEQEIMMPRGGEAGRDLWSFDPLSGLGNQIQQTPISEEWASSSRDGTTIYTYASADSGYTVYRFPLRSPSELEGVALGLLPHVREDLGKLYLSKPGKAGFTFEIHELNLDDPGGGSRALVKGDAVQWGATTSPDGRHLLFSSNQSGEYEVYLTTLPDARSRWQVSSAGGHWPRFSADGSEIFWAQGGGIFRASFDDSAGVRLGPPEELFNYTSTDWSRTWANGFSVTADGQRFLVVRADASEGEVAGQVVVVESWRAELDSR